LSTTETSRMADAAGAQPKERADFVGSFRRFILVMRENPIAAEVFVRCRAMRVREQARASRDPMTSLHEQLPAWTSALWQAALEGVVAAQDYGSFERANAERRARFVAARLDEVADGLQRAQVAEDDDERHEEIFTAHRALRRAEAAF
jgi:hypothetical protein